MFLVFFGMFGWLESLSFFVIFGFEGYGLLFFVWLLEVCCCYCKSLVLGDGLRKIWCNGGG